MPAPAPFQARKRAEGSGGETSETLMAELDKCTEELEGLRVAYEQYFLGLERRPPGQRHDKLKRRVVGLQTTTVKQTAVKFRAQALNAKLITYERMWSRTLKEIEDGVYKRDLFKARLHRQERDGKDGVKDEPALPAAAPVPSAPPPRPSGPMVPRPSAPVAAAGAQLSDQKIKAIYDAYLMAKRRCNEDTSKVSLESVASTLRQQVPVLMKQHNAKSVEFKVVIKDGKAVLRALPKE